MVLKDPLLLAGRVPILIERIAAFVPPL